MKSVFLAVMFSLFMVHAWSVDPLTWEKAQSAVQALTDSGSVVGAQVVLGDADELFLERSYGVRSASDHTPVDSETLFCIGSCSKPFASALLLTLVEDETLTLDRPVNFWLPGTGSLKTVSGESVRAPTLRELLSHRGGVYSQKAAMSKRQTRWIRDFKLTLEEAVNGIARESVLAAPGEAYAYSGAGYLTHIRSMWENTLMVRPTVLVGACGLKMEKPWVCHTPDPWLQAGPFLC